MKLLRNKSALKPFRLTSAMLAIICILPTNDVLAAVQGWDPNGTTSIGGDGTWDTTSAVWTPAGTQTQVASGSLVPFTAGSAALFCAGPSGSANQGTFTITVSGTISIGGIYNGFLNPGPCTLTITNGELSLAPGTAAFGIFNNSTVIYSTISGSGVLNPQSTGNLYLYGTNTYTGGTLLSAGGLEYFNNDSSFGTGTISVQRTSGNFAAILGQGGTTRTLANNFANNTSGGGINFAADASTPVVCAGNWSLGANNINIRNNGNNTSPLTLSGIISGTANVTLSGNNGGKITLSGANTYSGQTILAGGSSTFSVSVSSLNKVTGGVASSSLGHPTTAANGTIAIGTGANTSTLIYTGAGESSDRVINLAGSTGGAKIQADGTGALVLSANNTATVAGSKTLTLQGSSTAANSIGKIVDSSSGATSVAKAQAGTWKLTAANTYTGGTTVNAGTLEISGSVAGSVTNNSGTLTLDNASAITSANATLAASSGTTINLNYTGTNAINALVIDGVSQPSGVWGPVGSGAPNTSAIFAGTGYVNVLGKPVIVQQPVSGVLWQGDTTSFAFTVGVAGDLSTLTYQWKQNGANIPGATTSSYAIPSPVALSSAGTYSVAVTNAFGFATSANATLTVRGTNAYTQTIRGDSPISYWRLDETNGTVAFDGVGTNNGVYVNVNLNQPGFSSVAGSDPAIGIPANPANKGIMVVSNAAPAFAFGGFPFTLEAWGMSTNFGAGIKQRLISTLSLTGSGGYAFGFPSSTTLEFTSGGINDYDITLGNPLAQGVWYHFVAVYDGNNMNFYLNGTQVGSVAIPVSIPNPANQLALGNNPLTFPGEQLYGGIDEVAIYNYDLSGSQVANHYQARYSDLAAPTTTTPVVTPPTNYVSLSATITESAGGQGLTYQWYKGAGTGSPIGGATASTLALSNLQLSDSGSYHCVVTDIASHTADSPLASLTVVPIPTDASQLNLVNGLILHLPFDSDYKDISGRVNDGTAVGAPALVGSAVIGSSALHYGTTNGVGTNYVTLGVRSDLQFGATNDFTVAYWVRGNNGSLPYFCDAAGGLGGILGLTGGFYFGPSTNGNGSWEVGLAGNTHEGVVVGSSFINDGNWHHLVHSIKRSGNMQTYVDGAPVSSYAVSFITDSIDTSNPANIGQDGTGHLVLADAEGDLDDVAVWRRTLTDFEVSGIYLAGATNHVSFAPAVITPVALQVQQVSPGQYQIVWPGSGWTLQASPTVTGGYTNVPSATSPYPVPTSSGPQLFYRLKQ